MKENDNKGVVVKLDNYDLGLDIVRQQDEAWAFFKSLFGGRSSGVSSPREAAMVYGRCQELNLPFMSTIDHMCVIQGKVCADIHIKTALALRAGNTLWWEVIKDYEPQYQYTDGVSVWSTSLKPKAFIEKEKLEDPYFNKVDYCWDADSNKAIVDKGYTPIWNILEVHGKPYDYKTEIKFYRIRKLRNGEEKTITAYGRFSSLESHTAQLGYGKNGDYKGVRDPNGNWGKYERRMVYVRAFDNGLKEIASDLTMGMPEIGEMAEVAGMHYTVNSDNGNASIQKRYRDEPIEEVEVIEDKALKESDKQDQSEA